MDFVKKKAFEAQMKRVGLDSLSHPFGGPSASKDASTFSVFGSDSPDGHNDDNPAEEDIFPVVAACAFDEKPKNFPPLMHICYIDRSILSDEAAAPVKWAFRVSYTFLILLCFNTITAILFTALNNGKDWVNIVLSAIIAILLFIYQLFAYETAFRGAYRTSANLRHRFLLLCTANVVIISLYAFLGVAFFNGWARIPNIKDDSEEKQGTLRKVLAVIEAFGWTVLLFVNTYTLFDYYHLYKGKDQGLSPSALEAATNNTEALSNASQVPQNRRNDTNSIRVQEIRDRYGIP